ncbi:Cro/CI family transcriptional regulator [Azotobacter chroococcum]|uniref:Cro protein n=1 Tax=Azotobacter chroococcum TaxID=353 RepID=A0AAP9YGS8_9GAMM|nr:Cro/CI family transcriptional regulator [Azotobacter chroococcum]QQE90453.1 hypothetical protein GKQ51_09350 [Azotobacter chroococcum]
MHSTLSEFVTSLGQAKAAELLGITQGAVSKALRVGREIYVVRNRDGSYTAHEMRPFPSQAKRTAA